MLTRKSDGELVELEGSMGDQSLEELIAVLEQVEVCAVINHLLKALLSIVHPLYCHIVVVRVW